MMQANKMYLKSNMTPLNMFFLLASSGLGCSPGCSDVQVYCDITVGRGQRWNRLETFNRRQQQNTAFQPGINLLFN